MNKILKLTFVFLICGFIFRGNVYASNVYGGTYQISGPFYDYMTAVDLNSSDDIFVTGVFETQYSFKSGIRYVDLNGTQGIDDTDSILAYDDVLGHSCWPTGFISKYKSDGSYAWSRIFGTVGLNGGFAKDIVVDKFSNVFVTGDFKKDIYFFDENTDDVNNYEVENYVDKHTSNGYKDVFITKYNADGSYGWTRTFGGSGSNDSGRKIATDSNDNVYVVGDFWGTVDFDGTSGVDNHTSNGGSDTFITKYNADGSYGWTRTFGNSESNDFYGGDIKINSSNEVFVSNKYRDVIDFDGTSGVDEYDADIDGNVFITKYNADGSYGWTRTFNVNYGNLGKLSLYSNKIYVAGTFTGTADFDGTSGTDNHTSNGSTDFFISKYNFDGSYDSAVTFGDVEEEVGFIKLDSLGNIIVVGSYDGTKDLNDRSGVDSYTSSGGTSDIFLTKYSTDGSYDWTRILQGQYENDNISDFGLDSLGNIILVGGFKGFIDFDGTSGTDIHNTSYDIDYDVSTNNYTDAFLTKYKNDGSYGNLFGISITPLYRFWSDVYKGHFYTASEKEKNSIIANDPNWKYENIAYNVFLVNYGDNVVVPGSAPVYRFWSNNYNGHFYTASEKEKNSIIANDPNWKYEGEAFYVYSKEQPNTKPVYRFWSDNYKHHFYTASEKEMNDVKNNNPNWKYEGIAWWVVK